MEFTNKLLPLSQRVQQFTEECGDLKMIHDLPWTSIDKESERQVVQKFNQQATDQIAKLIKPLAIMPATELKDLPDYFGQSFMFGLHAAYDAALQNDTSRLQKIFSGVFIGALLASDKVREDVQGWNQQSQLILISEPMEDILALSGFIKIYSELFSNPELWEICKQTWDRYLELSDDPKQAIEKIIAGVAYRENIISMVMPRDTLRLNWDTKLTKVFEEKGFNVSTFSYRSNPFEENTELIHPSALIRALLNHHLISYEAQTVFYISYLDLRAETREINIEFPDRRDLQEQLRREERRDESSNDDHDDTEDEPDEE